MANVLGLIWIRNEESEAERIDVDLALYDGRENGERRPKLSQPEPARLHDVGAAQDSISRRGWERGAVSRRNHVGEQRHPAHPVVSEDSTSIFAQDRDICVVSPGAIEAQFEEPTQEARPIASEKDGLPRIDRMLEELFKQLLAVSIKVAQQDVVAWPANVLDEEIAA